MLATGQGTTSGDLDQGSPDVAWEIAPLRAAALRTERALDRRWETVRAAIIGGAVLLAVIGSAAALSLNGSTLPSGMGFLSAAGAATAEPDVTADEARDDVADQGTPPPTSDPTQPPSSDESAGTDTFAADAPVQPQPAGASPTAEPLPQPEPEPSVTPIPEPAPSAPGSGAPGQGKDKDKDAEDSQGLIGDLIDILLPGLLP